jgi:non-ribosomal peptide synthase protein (TIGR01720 family)
MEVAELVAHLRDIAVHLWVDGDDLRYTAPKGALTQDLRAELVERKAEILAFLRARDLAVEAAAPSPRTGEDELGPVETYVAPRTPTEETLAEIWAKVLGIKQVGIHDNFFELGGDSFMGMQVIAMANQAGLRLAPPMILEHQTIAELAAVQGTVLPVQAEQGLVTGPVPLLGIQQRVFLETTANPDYWTISSLFEVPQTIDPVLLKQTMQNLLAHHDALRTRFVREESGWRQFIIGLQEEAFTYVDISELAVAEQRAAIETAAIDVQHSLNLSAGPLLRAVLFHLGAYHPGRLLIVVHHLVADGASASILLEDFQNVYKQLARGERVQLPLKTTSVKQWTERLGAYAQSAELRQELDYWLNLPWEQIPSLPIDHPGGRNRSIKASRRIVAASLSIEETIALRQVLRTYNAQVIEVLLMALTQALTQWTGGRWIQTQVTDSGRHVIPNAYDIDLSRTVGDLVLERFVILERKEADNPGDALKSIQEQLRRIPNRGLGFNLLLRCSRDAKAIEKLQPLLRNDVVINYLGSWSQQWDSESIFLRRASEPTGPPESPQNPIIYPVECPAFISRGCLTVHWYYSNTLHKRTTIEKVARNFTKALQALITYCQSLYGDQR